MNIGILTRFLSIGGNWDSGIGQHFRILADELSSRGHTVRVFLLCHLDQKSEYEEAYAELKPIWNLHVVVCETRWFDWVKKKSWPLYQLLFHLKSAWVGRKALLDSDRSHHLDVCETHSYYFPSLILLRSSMAGRMILRVSTLQVQMTRESPLRSRILQLSGRIELAAINRSVHLVTHASAHLSLIRCEFRDPLKHFYLVPHAVRDPREVLSSDVVAAAVKRDKAVTFLFVGRFEFRKGIDVLLSAIPVVKSHVPNAQFVLAGGRGDGSQWNAFVAEFPALVESCVRSLGRVDSELLNSLFRECTIFVAPSRYESFGLIYAEAMSYGKPSIGCTVGGVPDVLLDNVTGLLVPPGDSASLAAAMIRLASDDALILELGRNARREYETRFNPENLAVNSELMYADVIKANAEE